MIVKDFDISKLKLKEQWISESLGTTVLFFIAPKEWIVGKYPEANSAEISCEFYTVKTTEGIISLMISPTKNGCSYDWDNLELDDKTVKELIKFGLKQSAYLDCNDRHLLEDNNNYY